LQIKNIPTGPGDDFKIDATWSKGDTKQVISTSAASPTFTMFSGTGRAGAYQSIGFGATSDACIFRRSPAADGSLHLTEASASVARSTTTGIRTGRRACSAATRGSL